MASNLLDALVDDVEKIDSSELPAGAAVPGLFVALLKRLEQDAPQLLADVLAPAPPAVPHGMTADAIQAQGQAAVAAGSVPPAVGSPTAAEDAATIANQNAEIQQLRNELANRPAS